MGGKVLAGVLLLFAAVVGGWSYQRQAKIEHGQEAFKRIGCGGCHFAGGAPNLTNVAQRYDRPTLTRFIQNPETIYRERGKRPLNSTYFPMPNLHVTPGDAEAIVAFLGNQSR